MQFIVIGESLKRIDKFTQHGLLPNYPEVDWKGIMGFRDIITHHYFDIDAEEVFWICTYELDRLLGTIKKILRDLE